MNPTRITAGAEKTKTFQEADCFCKNFPGEKKRVQSCLRQFATNARKSVSCIRFLCNYNEAHYYSEVFHLIKGACKAGQIESLESFYCILENSQPALTEGLMVWWDWGQILPQKSGCKIFCPAASLWSCITNQQSHQTQKAFVIPVGK